MATPTRTDVELAIAGYAAAVGTPLVDEAIRDLKDTLDRLFAALPEEPK